MILVGSITPGKKSTTHLRAYVQIDAKMKKKSKASEKAASEDNTILHVLPSRTRMKNTQHIMYTSARKIYGVKMLWL